MTSPRSAGVSRTTTSRVLNNRPRVDDETRRRVLNAIDELGYVPSPTARRLSLGRTWTIDVVASYLTRPQAIERLRGAESVLGDTSFDIVIHNVESPERRERYLRQLPTSNRTDGVLLVSLPPTSANLRALAAGPVPVVLIDVHGADRGRDPARPRRRRRRRRDRVARYLHTLGHRSIGFVADAFENPYGFTSSRDRYTGFTELLGRPGRRGRGSAWGARVADGA